jgi:hypothetical protein
VFIERASRSSYGGTDFKQCISCNNGTRLQELSIVIVFVLSVKGFMCSSPHCLLNGTLCSLGASPFKFQQHYTSGVNVTSENRWAFKKSLLNTLFFLHHSYFNFRYIYVLGKDERDDRWNEMIIFQSFPLTPRPFPLSHVMYFTTFDVCKLNTVIGSYVINRGTILI